MSEIDRAKVSLEEREKIVDFILSHVEPHKGKRHNEIFTVLAKKIKNGKHWLRSEMK